MDWIYFVILAALAYTATDMLDKFLVDKKVNKPIVLPIFVRATSIIPICLIALFMGFSMPGPQFAGWIFVAGLFSTAGTILFYRALQAGEVSRVLPLYQFIPVFVLFISFLFIGEVLGFFDYVGFVIIVLGGLVISSKSMSKLLKVERIFWLVAASSFLIAVSYVIMKFVLSSTEYWGASILLWLLNIAIISSLLLLRDVRKNAKTCMKKLDRTGKMLILLDAITSVLAFIFNYIAISLGPVTLVEAAGNMMFIFILISAFLLTRYFPHLLKEDFDTKASLQKIAGIVLIIAGILLTQLL
jgi:transporter family protein